MSASPPLNSLGRRRSPAAVPGTSPDAGPAARAATTQLTRRAPRRSSRSCAVAATAHTATARGLIVVLWRAGLRIQEALDLTELDLDPRRGSVLVRRGKGGHRREVGMDDWGFEQLQPWLQARQAMPVGPLFCVINGRTRGRAWHASAARAALRRRAVRAGVRRRFAPHQLRHAHALELLREGVPLNVIQRQLGHRNLGVTSVYLQGIDPDEIIQTVHARRPPMIPASVGLALSGRG
jgi:site-specific recombinase XerD